MIHWFVLPQSDLKVFKHVQQRYELPNCKLLSGLSRQGTIVVMFRDRTDMQHTQLVWHMFKDQEKTEM